MKLRRLLLRNSPAQRSLARRAKSEFLTVWRAAPALYGLLLGLAAALACAAADQWQTSFPVEKSRLGPTGANRYFVLQPGYRLHYAHGGNTSVTSVLDETKLIDGVTTRVVEDRETKNGQLVELTRDYYAIDSQTGDVYYFGEEVDVYKNGKVTGHEGSWLSGVNGAKFGLMVPA